MNIFRFRNFKKIFCFLCSFNFLGWIFKDNWFIFSKQFANLFCEHILFFYKSLYFLNLNISYFQHLTKAKIFVTFFIWIKHYVHQQSFEYELKKKQVFINDIALPNFVFVRLPVDNFIFVSLWKNKLKLIGSLSLSDLYKTIHWNW